MSVGAQMVVVLKAFVERCVSLALGHPFEFSWLDVSQADVFHRFLLVSCDSESRSRRSWDRGRTASYPTAPAQIPACSFPAPGSSLILASAGRPSGGRVRNARRYVAGRARSAEVVRGNQPSCNSGAGCVYSATSDVTFAPVERTRSSSRSCRALRSSCSNHGAWHSAAGTVPPPGDGDSAYTIRLPV